MSDYIKREDAIEYLVDNMTWMDADGVETSEEDKREAIAELIKGVPSADAVPRDDYMDLHSHFVNWQPIKRGKWKVAGDTTHYYICSVCGKPGDCFDNYCRSCGAKMERPCDKCQEWDCYGCDYKQTERSK